MMPIGIGMCVIPDVNGIEDRLHLSQKWDGARCHWPRCRVLYIWPHNVCGLGWRFNAR